jgi:small subunit ribosomal protein S6e
VPKFKLIISDPKSGKSSSMELDEQRSKSFVGRHINEVVDGSIIGTKGKVRITGGSDKDGIPMRKEILGGSKKFLILSGGVGFNPKRKGERKRKVVRGNMITEDTYQINVVITEETEK